jgi:hypothetical protein
MTSRKVKLIPVVARLNQPRKPTKQQRLRQQREVAAWEKKAGRR